MMSEKVILTPVAVRFPSDLGTYSPSKLIKKKEVSFNEFLRICDQRIVRLPYCAAELPSVEELENPLYITAYVIGGQYYIL
jgi:hypothetical protein